MKAKEVFPAVFSRHAAAYRDRVMTPVRKQEARGRLLVLELLQAAPGERVLDLACGPGTLTYALAAAVGPRGLVVGTDLARGMLQLAREEAPSQLALLRMDSEQLAFSSGAFSAVACGHGLQFCPDLAMALGEVRRVLRPGGRFAASFPADGRHGHAFSLLEEVFADLPPVPEVEERAATLATLREPARVLTAALEAGFSSAEVRQVEETITYGGPEELVSRVCGWWDCAWRLESLEAAEQDRVRSRALTALRKQFGDGPIRLPGGSHVLFARA